MQERIFVTVEHTGAVAVITLNRPEALNAFNQAQARQLAAALRDAAEDAATRAVMIIGAGDAFSAGQDLRELAEETAERGAGAVGDQLRLRFNPIVVRIRTMEKPVIAAVNGVATGAGLGFVLASDYRIAAESASFVMAPLRIGLISGAGSSLLLPAIVGLGKAGELALLGERISAAEALAIGMLSLTVPDEELFTAAMEVAERFASLPTKAIGLTKRAFNHAVLPRLEEHLEYEASLQQLAAGTGDHREGLAAALAKRAPAFTGA